MASILLSGTKLLKRLEFLATGTSPKITVLAKTL